MDTWSGSLLFSEATKAVKVAFVAVIVFAIVATVIFIVSIQGQNWPVAVLAAIIGIPCWLITIFVAVANIPHK